MSHGNLVGSLPCEVSTKCYKNKELTVGTLEKNNFLWVGYDEVTKISFTGVYSIADLVNNFLKLNPKFPNGIYDADNEDVKIAIHQIFESGLISNPISVLSKPAKSEKRTIILTTHHLEEADELAVRIGIMAN